MRIPWGAPIISDATKIGLAGQPVPLTGCTLYELLLQQASYNDFSTDFGELTEVDSGTNVNIAGGLLTIKGSGAWNANGVRKVPVAIATPGKFRCSFTPRTATTAMMIGLAEDSLVFQVDPAKLFADTARLMIYTYGNEEFYGTNPLVVGTTYQIEAEWTAAKKVTLCIKGGVWTDWTTIYSCTKTKLGTTVGFQINCYTAWAAPWEFDDYYRFAGYATDGPTLTYVADAGSGYLFSSLNFTNFAATGSWLTTNARFKYSFDNGTPAYNGSWLALAQLQALGAIGGSYRYVRLQIQMNSDGVTQQYAGELNADNGIGVPSLASTADPLNDGTIIARIAPGDVVRLLGGLQSPIAATVDVNIDIETLNAGTGLWSKVADVVAPAGVSLAAGVLKTFATMAGAEVEWTSTAVTERVYRWRVDVTGGLTRTLITYFEAVIGGAPAATISTILSAAVVAVGGTLTVTGGITLSATVTGAAVTLKRYKKSDGSLVATTVNAAAVDFTAGVQKTWAQIAGAAVTFTPSVAREEYLVAEISGGTPTVTTEAGGQVGYVVIGAAPGISFSATGVVVDGPAGATNSVYYRKDGAATAWTLLGSRSDDGEVPFGTLAEGSYLFQAVAAVAGVNSLASDAKRCYVGGSSRTLDHRVWLDCASALDGAAALAPVFIDREECKVVEISRGKAANQRLPYLGAEWGGEVNDLDVEETDYATGKLVLSLILRDDPRKARQWELDRWVKLIVQTLAADPTRGNLVFKWKYRGTETPGGIIAPLRVALITFEYEHAPVPAARVAT